MGILDTFKNMFQSGEAETNALESNDNEQEFDQEKYNQMNRDIGDHFNAKFYFNSL